MNIVIATGIFPPDIGGPAQYAKNLYDEFLERGHKVRVLSYRIEKKLPAGIRHFVYFLKSIFAIRKGDFILVLDTFSVGLPVTCANIFFKKKIIIRTGGDFLWESYVERTGCLTPFRAFYETLPDLSSKERLIFKLSRFVLENCSAIVFSTDWQKEIFETYYRLNQKKIHIIENFYGEKLLSKEPAIKNFLWAGRPINLKNTKKLSEAFEAAKKENMEIRLDIISAISHDDLIKKMAECYAVILPSVSEISPNFILDAVRLNKPFIVTRENGLYQKLKNIAIFVDPLDSNDIKNKILFLSKPEVYNEYKNKVENFTFTHSWKEIADEFLALVGKS